MIALTKRDGGVHLPVKAVPGASAVKISVLGDRLKVCVNAPAEKGKANQAVVRALAEFFGAAVDLVSGAGSPQKTVLVHLSGDAVRARIESTFGRS